MELDLEAVRIEIVQWNEWNEPLLVTCAEIQAKLLDFNQSKVYFQDGNFMTRATKKC